MISITNLFSDEKIKSKESKIKNDKTNISQSLKQGKKFKKYQNKIENSLVKDAQLLSSKEGFTNNSENATGLTEQTKEIIDKNNYTGQQQNLDDLKQEYQTTLQEYQALLEQISGDATEYVDRTNPNNPYLNKVVSFSTGEIAYVTNQGIVKYIPSTQILQSLSISQKSPVALNIPWQSVYNTPGTQIPTNPPLVTGTPVKMGQSLGNEGSNVFVSEFLPPSVKPSYMGCYAANSTNDNMNFIDGSPPKSSGPQIQNGNFSQPTLNNNSYQYINSASQVPGWYFGGACLINNSKAWGYPIPYPGGNQCVSIQNTNYIFTTLTLNTGVNYTIKFSGCSRNCCKNTNVGNPININLYTTSNAFISKIANFTPSPVNKWQNFSYTFTVPTTQSYNLYFSGTNTSGDQSTAISNVSLSTSSSSSTYSYNECQQAAIDNGYQYFALQNVNYSSGKGYCAVSNSEPNITKYGNSMVPNKLVKLWSSNTTNQTGNSATLSVTGSLQVINSSGQAVYTSPSNNANPSNYLGCYGDGSNRAMTTAYSGGSQKFNNSQCQQAAQKSGYQYYGLQNSTSGKNAQCYLSNNLSQTTKYGTATNCTKISNGSWSGGGWSNAVYSTTPQSNYFLILQNDGNMCIYRGTGPNDNQGFIWATGTNGKTQNANPNAAASLGKYGKNWIASGSTLAPGDFIGSSNGNLQLVMQSDGNLVLYTFQMETNCQKMSDGNMGGGVNGNAAYNIGMKAINTNMGKLAYIDSDSNLYTYPSSNQQYTTTYNTTIQKSNTKGNDIQGAAFNNATVQSCQTACNNNSSCAGFVFNSSGNCYPKTNSMYPFGGEITSDNNSTIYIRDIQPLMPPTGVSKNTMNTDTNTFQNYNTGSKMNSSYGIKLTSVQKQQIEQLQTKLNLLSSAISGTTTNFQMGIISAENQSNENVTGTDNYLEELNDINDDIQSLISQNSGNIQNILNDSDIVILQKNYSYLLWSILAAGTVLISMNVVKKY